MADWLIWAGIYGVIGIIVVLGIRYDEHQSCSKEAHHQDPQ